MESMSNFVTKYLQDRRGGRMRVLDVGAMNVNGTYRDLFDDPLWEYVGLDMGPGPGVDKVLDSPYSWRGISPKSYDVIISGQAFEHIEFPWISMLHITRSLVEGGLVCLIVPSGGHEHRYPVDCWRYYPDGVRALARWADLEPLAATTTWHTDRQYPDDSAQWADTVLVARRPPSMVGRRQLVEAKRWLLLQTMTRQASLRHGVFQ